MWYDGDGEVADIDAIVSHLSYMALAEYGRLSQ
jgi:hypothetical protein